MSNRSNDAPPNPNEPTVNQAEQQPAGDATESTVVRTSRSRAKSVPESSTADVAGARGVVRKVDDLGRVVIPKEFRRAFGIVEGDLVDLTIEGDAIAVRRFESRCALCDGTDELGMFRTRLVCAECVATLRAR